MLSVRRYFQNFEGFPFSELFGEELKGFDDVLYVWDILKRIQQGFVSKVVKPQIQGIVEDGAILQGEDIFIGRNSRVEAGALIKGPSIIGNNVEIRHGAYVRGNVIVGDGAVIGHSSEVIRSIFLPGAKAPHFNYVGDSILGSNVNLGAGTKLSNLKNDGTEVTVRVEENTIKTGMRKFGAILGDGSMLGCNSVTNPGTVMGQDAWVYPNATISGFFPSKCIVKLKQKIETVCRA